MDATSPNPYNYRYTNFHVNAIQVGKHGPADPPSLCVCGLCSVQEYTMGNYHVHSINYKVRSLMIRALAEAIDPIISQSFVIRLCRLRSAIPRPLHQLHDEPNVTRRPMKLLDSWLSYLTNGVASGPATSTGRRPLRAVTAGGAGGPGRRWHADRYEPILMTVTSRCL